ncbi:hypothetical protein [Thiohalophilus sp.]|uniref:hypothetical protein n=1 Tax=Thiohalophilus sp. TaxID=3028392 RepID=UPI002ACD6F6C|nr:hypothetical protein [Thiohalophilus sp.]MDZ7803643.1 hypothetical protein [Thiohalophilus sp.]
MPDKPTLILVHGMGEHTGDSFREEVTTSLNYALGLYEKWQGKQIQERVNLVPFGYNTIFNEHREKLADTALPLVQRLDKLQGAGVTGMMSQEIARWDSELNQDHFFKTHWLDVIFYRYTGLGELIRVKLARLISETIRDVGAQNVHVLGHSLGTSVVHDTLASLYAPPGESSLDHNLSLRTSKLASVHLVANVSRLLQSFVDVNRSVVNPCRNGCVGTYYQYRHVLDPFMIPSPFEPVINDIWCEEIEHDAFMYQELRPKLITDLNTHAVTHYLKNPVCHVPLLQVLNIDFAPNKTERKKAFKAHQDTALQGKAEFLQQKWDTIDLADKESVEAFIRAAQGMRDMLAAFGKDFE